MAAVARRRAPANANVRRYLCSEAISSHSSILLKIASKIVVGDSKVGKNGAVGSASQPSDPARRLSHALPSVPVACRILLGELGKVRRSVKSDSQKWGVLLRRVRHLCAERRRSSAMRTSVNRGRGS